MFISIITHSPGEYWLTNSAKSLGNVSNDLLIQIQIQAKGQSSSVTAVSENIYIFFFVTILMIYLFIFLFIYVYVVDCLYVWKSTCYD
jgi:hypothetical protein